MKNLEQRLLNGEVITFSNENTMPEDIRMGEVFYTNKGPIQGFRIWFNGEFIHISITFNSFKNRLDRLIDRWKLEETEF